MKKICTKCGKITEKCIPETEEDSRTSHVICPECHELGKMKVGYRFTRTYKGKEFKCKIVKENRVTWSIQMVHGIIDVTPRWEYRYMYLHKKTGKLIK